MRVHLMACLAILIIGTGGYFFLNAMQSPSGDAFATGAARIRTSWAWRYTGTSEPITRPEECEKREPWQWIFVDFGKPRGEAAVCSDSQ
jgi:hypothetical protein